MSLLKGMLFNTSGYQRTNAVKMFMICFNIFLGLTISCGYIDNLGTKLNTWRQQKVYNLHTWHTGMHSELAVQTDLQMNLEPTRNN